jgi:hypothetical protein
MGLSCKHASDLLSSNDAPLNDDDDEPFSTTLLLRCTEQTKDRGSAMKLKHGY